jgi:hypothetical protein
MSVLQTEERRKGSYQLVHNRKPFVNVVDPFGHYDSVFAVFAISVVEENIKEF